MFMSNDNNTCTCAFFELITKHTLILIYPIIKYICTHTHTQLTCMHTCIQMIYIHPHI